MQRYYTLRPYYTQSRMVSLVYSSHSFKILVNTVFKMVNNISCNLISQRNYTIEPKNYPSLPSHYGITRSNSTLDTHVTYQLRRNFPGKPNTSYTNNDYAITPSIRHLVDEGLQWSQPWKNSQNSYPNYTVTVIVFWIHTSTLDSV